MPMHPIRTEKKSHHSGKGVGCDSCEFVQSLTRYLAGLGVRLMPSGYIEP